MKLAVDGERRAQLRRNHSATHLLHAALREVLGETVAQKGSLVAPDMLRFDFSHAQPVSLEQRAEIERRVNAEIMRNAEVSTREMPLDAAKQSGAIALFGEKYAEDVRVVQMGTSSSGGGASTSFSTELCGGTHVTRTGDIGALAITSESGVAAGVRRIVALTGAQAVAHWQNQTAILDRLAGQVKVPANQLSERVAKLQTDLKDARRKQDTPPASAAAHAAFAVGKHKVALQHFADRGVNLKATIDGMRGGGDTSSAQIFVACASDAEGTTLVVGVVDGADLDARSIVRGLAPAIGAKGGGGRKDLAQSGGSIAITLEQLRTAIEAQLA